MKLSKNFILIFVVVTVFAIAIYAQVESSVPVSEIYTQVSAMEPAASAVAQERQSPVQQTQNVALPAASAQPAVITQPAQTVPQEDYVTRIYQLRMAKAQDVVQILRKIFTSSNVIADDRVNSIIFVGTVKDCYQVEEILQNVDIETERSTSSLPSNIVYRVYAVEIPVAPSANSTMKQSFNMQLSVPGENLLLKESSLQQVLSDAVSVDTINFSYQTGNPDNQGKSISKNIIFLRGKTVYPPHETIQNIIERVEESAGQKVVIDLLEYKSPTDDQPTQDFGGGNPFYDKLQEFMREDAPSPDQPVSLNAVKKTLKNLLGNDLQIRGFWFGNASIPGNCMVPLGPWTLSMDMKSKDERPEASLMQPYDQRYGVTQKSVSSTHDSSEFQLNINLMENEKDVLTNTVNARIGRPVIIGYTRNIAGNFIPGALVVVPEEDFNISPASASNKDMR